jgi:hypothetical protein
MKMNALIFTCLVMAIIGCNGLTQSDTVKEFIPGTYSAEWQTELNTTRDTLSLQALTQDGSATYLIIRRSQVTFINAAKNRPPEYRLVKWAGTYDSKTKTIFINNNGRVLSFEPQKEILWMGTIKYKKL